MITLFKPATGTFVATSYQSLNDPLLLQLNILIELRAMTAMFQDAQMGTANQTMDKYRSDVVNDAVNPIV